MIRYRDKDGLVRGIEIRIPGKIFRYGDCRDFTTETLDAAFERTIQRLKKCKTSRKSTR